VRGLSRKDRAGAASPGGAEATDEGCPARGSLCVRLCAVAALTAGGLSFGGCSGIGARPWAWASPATGPSRPAPPTKAELTLAELKPPVSAPTNTPDAEKLSKGDRAKIEAAKKLLIGQTFPLAKENPRYAQAARTLKQAAKVAPDDLELHFALGRWHLVNQRDDPATLAFRTALKCSQAGPENPLAAEALLKLGGLLGRKGYHTAALECFTELSKRIDRHARAYSQRPALRRLVIRPDRLLSYRGELLGRLGRVGEAADLLERAFRRDRTNSRAARLLIESLLAAKEFSRAEKLLTEIADEPAQSAQTPALAQAICKASGDKTAPRRIAEALRQRKELDGELAVALARACEELGWPDEATGILESLIKTMPGNAAAVRFLVGLYARQARHEKAFRLLARLLAEDPGVVENVRQGVEDVLAGPVPVDIAKMFAVAVAGEKAENKFALYYVAGRLAEARGRTALAGEQYRKAIAENKRFLPAYEALAEVYLALKRYRRLDGLVQQARDAAEAEYFCAYLKGRTHLARRQFVEAWKDSTRAVELNSRYVPALLLRARASLRIGRASDAVSALLNVTNIAPENEEAHRMLVDLLLSGRQYARAARVIDKLRQHRPQGTMARILQAKLDLHRGKIDSARNAAAELRRAAPDDVQVDLLDIQLELIGRKAPLPAKDLDRLVLRLGNIIRRHPDQTAPKLILAELLAVGGGRGSQSATGVWREIYEQTNRHPDVARAYAAALLQAGERKKALPLLLAAAKENRLDLSAQEALLHTLVKLGRTDQAAAQCRQMQEFLDGWIADGGGDAAEVFRTEQMRLYALAGLYDEAVAVGRRLIARTPESTALKRMLVSLLADGKQFPRAHALLDEWIDKAEAGSGAYRRMKMSLYMQAEQVDQAERFALEWIKDQPSVIMPRRMLIAMLVDAGRYGDAAKLLDSWTEMPPETATLPTQPAAPKAVTSWARQSAASLLMIQDKYAEALKRLETYVRLDPANSQLLVMKSACLSELGRDDQALADMEAARRLAPKDAEVANNLGYLYAERGIRLDDAERMIRSALAEKPGQIAYQDSLAWTFYKKGKIPEAGRIFEQIFAAWDEEHRDHPVILDHAGDTMWRLGNKDKALKLWRQAVELAKGRKTKTAEVRRVMVGAAAKIAAVEAGRPPAVAPLGKGYKQQK